MTQGSLDGEEECDDNDDSLGPIPSIPHDAEADVPPPGAMAHLLPIPDIPTGTEAERPPEGGGTSSVFIDTPRDPQGDHTRWMDKVKLTFAVWVVMISFAVVVGLTLTQFITQRILDSELLDSAIDWAKGTTTIALGFVLGRAVEEAKREPA